MNGNQTIGKFFSLKLRSLPICVPLSTAYDKKKQDNILSAAPVIFIHSSGSGQNTTFSQARG